MAQGSKHKAVSPPTDNRSQLKMNTKELSKPGATDATSDLLDNGITDEAMMPNYIISAVTDVDFSISGECSSNEIP